MAPSTQLVRRELVEGVAVISFNRPERHNALNDAMAAEWYEALEWAIDDREVRSILLRGEGRSFSSGRDTKELGKRPEGVSDYNFVRSGQDKILALADSPKPVVVAMKGYLIGGSLEIALRADYRVAADDISLAMTEILHGIVPDTGGTQLLAILAGPSKAKYAIMTGEPIHAEKALAWGLVDEVVQPDELDERALGVARRFAAGPPQAIAIAKQLVDHVWADVVRRGMRQELLAITALFGSAEYREMRAGRDEGRPGQ